MPYIIAVLALVVIGVGFTLLKVEQSPADVTPIMVTENLESSPPLTATTIPAVIEPLQEDTSVPKTETPTPTPPPVKTPVSIPTPVPVPQPVEEIPSVPLSDYVDGSYRSQVSYRTPEDTYSLDLTLTIVNDVITNSSVSFDTKGVKDSYSKRFSSAYQSSVIGQDLGSISLSRVGGASLTTRAFNNAVSNIRNQAKM